MTQMNGRTNSSSNVSNSLGSEIPLDPVTSFLCEARNSQVDITWTDPKDKYATPEGEQMEDTDQLVSQWAYTKIVRKENTQPSGPSDGVTVYTETVRNEHQSTIFEDTGVTNGVTYYYAAYAYNTAGDCSEGAFSEGITPIEWSPVLAENSWEQIDSACTQGVAQSLWSIGDEIDIIAKSQTLTCVIVGFDQATLANGYGVAAITFGMKNLMASKTDKGPFSQYPGGSNEADVDMQTMTIWLQGSILPTMASDLLAILQYVTLKSASAGDIGNLGSGNTKLFSFSAGEVLGGYSDGPQYPYFSTAINRQKKLGNGSGAQSGWWTRSTYSCMSGGYADHYDGALITATGELSHHNSATREGVCFGFCIGKQASL